MHFPGFWLDLNKFPAEVIPVQDHNSYVLQNPQRFGLSMDQLRPASDLRGRDKNLMTALRRGFARVRGTAQAYSVEFFLLGRLMDYVFSIAEALPRMGIKDNDALHIVMWEGSKSTAYDVEVEDLKDALKPGHEADLEKIFGTTIHEYKDIKGENVGPSIVEVSLSRIWHHYQEGGFAILTSWKTPQGYFELPGEERKAVDEAEKSIFSKFRTKVRDAGYGYVSIAGVWTTKDGIKTEEPSLLIPAINDIKDLREKAIGWGAEYDQDAVIVHDPGIGTQLIDPVTGTVVERFARFRPDAIAASYSKLKRGKHVGRTFVFEGFYRCKPHNMLHAMVLKSEGEIFDPYWGQYGPFILK